jgi:hypothetical protein
MVRDKILVKKDLYVVHLFLFINTALCVMLLMRAYPLLGQVGGGWALEILTFLGPEMALDVISQGQKSLVFRAQPPPTCPSNGFVRIKGITYGAV